MGDLGSFNLQPESTLLSSRRELAVPMLTAPAAQCHDAFRIVPVESRESFRVVFAVVILKRSRGYPLTPILGIGYLC